MAIYSIEGTDDEYIGEDMGDPYILMAYPKPSSDHVCFNGTWVLSSASILSAAANAYLESTAFVIADEDAYPDIVAARIAVSSTL